MIRIGQFWLPRRRVQAQQLPEWWRPTPTGAPTFHPSLRTAAELVGHREDEQTLSSRRSNAA